MPSRVALPGAKELFRQTGPSPVESPLSDGESRASGRIRHDEKITVYVSADELIALEQARITLRQGGITVDRGRIVRAALACALSDLDVKGLDAEIVSRLGW